MKLEKVPDSTYDMIGGLDQQIKEIKEVSWEAPSHTSSRLLGSLLVAKNRRAVQVIELPIKHPELFEALGVAQPKVVDAAWPSC